MFVRSSDAVHSHVVACVAGIILGILAFLGLSGGGVYAYNRYFRADGVSYVANNPLYSGSGFTGDNPLYQAY